LETTCSFAKDTTHVEIEAVVVWVFVVVMVVVWVFNEPAKYPAAPLTAIRITTSAVKTSFLMPEVMGWVGFTRTHENGLSVLGGG